MSNEWKIGIALLPFVILGILTTVVKEIITSPKKLVISFLNLVNKEKK